MADEKETETNPYLDVSLLSHLETNPYLDPAFTLLEEKDDVLKRSDPITLNVGGIKYQTYLNTLCKHKDSILYKMFASTGKHALHPCKDGTYFIDRNGKYFEYIMDYLRDGTVLFPVTDRAFIIKKLLIEAAFYKLRHLNAILTSYDIEQQSNIIKYKQILQVQQWITEEHSKQVIANAVPQWELLYKYKKNAKYDPMECTGHGSLLYLFKTRLSTFGVYSKGIYQSKYTKEDDNFVFYLKSNNKVCCVKKDKTLCGVRIGYQASIHTGRSGTDIQEHYPKFCASFALDNEQTGILGLFEDSEYRELYVSIFEGNGLQYSSGENIPLFDLDRFKVMDMEIVQVHIN